MDVRASRKRALRTSMRYCALVFACALSSACVGHDARVERQSARPGLSVSAPRPAIVRPKSEFLRGQALLHVSRTEAPAAPLNIHARAWGCEQLSNLSFGDPIAAPGPEQRFSFRADSGDVDEWFVPSDDRLEQGFTISNLPTCSAAEAARSRSSSWLHPAGTALSAPTAARVFPRWLGCRPQLHRRAFARQRQARATDQDRAAREAPSRFEVDVRGAKLPLVVDPQVWVEQQKLRPPPPEPRTTTLGTSVAVSGDALAVGAPLDDTKGDAAGAIYPFTRAGVSWTQQTKIVASDGQAGDAFGFCAAATATYLAVCAPYDDDGGTDAGSVYVFTRSGSTWGSPKKIVAADAKASAELGSAVAVDGTTLLIGASVDSQIAAAAGAAYVYVVSGGNWTLQKKLMASDGSSGDVLGTSVGLSGDTAIVGAPYDSDVATNAGAAYVFVRNGTTWSQQTKLVADDTAANAQAGQSVSISGDTAVVGAYGDTTKGTTAGAVYVWTRSGTTWSKQQKLYASDAAASAQFGYAVAVVGDALAVGASSDSSGRGAAYSFVRAGASWTQSPKLQASDAAGGANYGTYVSLDEDTLAVGASVRQGRCQRRAR